MTDVSEQDIRALYVAVWRNRPEEVLALLNKGVSINQTYVNDRNLVHVAAWFNHCDLLQTLIAKGAKINELDALGTTPLLLAIRNKSQSCFKALSQQRSQDATQRFLLNVPQGSPPTYPLHVLVEEGLLDWITWAKHHGFIDDLNVKNEAGETLAHVAHRKSHWKIFHYLVGSGMDTSLTNNEGLSVKDLVNSRGSKKRSLASKPVHMIEPNPQIV